MFRYITIKKSANNLGKIPRHDIFTMYTRHAPFLQKSDKQTFTICKRKNGNLRTPNEYLCWRRTNRYWLVCRHNVSSCHAKHYRVTLIPQSICSGGMISLGKSWELYVNRGEIRARLLCIDWLWKCWFRIKTVLFQHTAYALRMFSWWDGWKFAAPRKVISVADRPVKFRCRVYTKSLTIRRVITYNVYTFGLVGRLDKGLPKSFLVSNMSNH